MKLLTIGLFGLLVSACGPRVWYLRMQPGVGGTLGVQGGSEDQRRAELERMSANACQGRRVLWGVPELVSTTEICSSPNGMGGTNVSSCDDNRVEVRFACR